jgi:NADPH-dependent curcumin reductase CurA
MLMSPELNRQVRLKFRPTGIPQADHFEIVEAAVPEVGDGQLLIRNEYS